MSEPKTAQEWAEQYFKEYENLPNDDCMPLFLDIIRQAQEQSFTDGYQAGQVAARRDAIEECAKQADWYATDHSLPEGECCVAIAMATAAAIRSLLRNEGSGK